jgi:hypothetical protein
MNDRIAIWLIESRIKIAFFSLLIIVGLAAGLFQLQFNSSYKIFFDKTNEMKIFTLKAITFFLYLKHLTAQFIPQRILQV